MQSITRRPLDYKLQASCIQNNFPCTEEKANQTLSNSQYILKMQNLHCWSKANETYHTVTADTNSKNSLQGNNKSFNRFHTHVF